MVSSTDPPDLAGLHREPWAAHARHWHRLGPPLRPWPEDLARLRSAWLNSLNGRKPVRRLEVLLLGVTPELAAFPWAENFFLTAVDASERMIRAVWPGDSPGRKAILGDWLKLPLPNGSFDLVLSDCGLAPLSRPGQMTALGSELRRVLRSDGCVAMRHLMRPTPQGTLSAVVQAAKSGSIGNFHELKLRLLLALPADPAGICLAQAWDNFQQLFPSRPDLARWLGCSLETIATIDAYRDQDARYAFPDLRELAGAFSSFTLRRGPAGHYPLADCCPVFTLTPEP